MARLNYHHLQYFWHIVKVGSLTKAAEKLHISQSALSSQIRQLEESLDCALFLRQGRKLVLTEFGNLAFSYADSIFTKGIELENLLRKGIASESQTLRIGVLSTMSRNFIESFVEPLLNHSEIKLEISASGQTNLLNALSNHQIDLALTNIEVRGNTDQLWECILLDRQPISVIGPAEIEIKHGFSAKYAEYNWILPNQDSPIRAAFDGLCALHHLEPHIVAEANDMAMLRLLARDSRALTVMPEVVVKDELKNGVLKSFTQLEGIFENFYAVTIKKHFRKFEISQLVNQFLVKKRAL
ncbi:MULTISPECIES: LysR family transcriptional regulator [unclassified Methylophilus]|jgi:LysR family transcriptional regulator, transcriptional activator of nhaA|uniref:LysR family transcriptional regulator n=1 Tax=Methylophilus glucosoxydans TaxID=752553 RepID=A0ABW3GGW8_9PROT|nr:MULTISPECIES: LysR family transcriptional regulator [unclassified Methylophilus]MBF5039258.1 LysR family transcriptional regulator [Methylophilus sp. 13]MDF0377423.1 LysR family transcriptional regulator [Methylophilus sp. YYY-1]BEV08701.1 LysR family transcriptional regulator [Methylophilus sp. DW102]